VPSGEECLHVPTLLDKCRAGAFNRNVISTVYSLHNSGEDRRQMPLALGRLFLFGCALCFLLLGGCAVTPYYNITDFNTVVVDAGHGGRDSGASTRGSRSRLLEKDLALDVSRRVAVKLRAAGFRTIMTRSDDRFIPLDERADISNAQSKSVFVAIHFNDTRRRSIHGAETYHNGRGTWQLAARIERYLAAMPCGANRGVHTANFRVLRKSRGPALLVECGFLSNPDEAARCANAVWRDRVADCIARGIIEQRR